jgi:hypothetical protein
MLNFSPPKKYRAELRTRYTGLQRDLKLPCLFRGSPENEMLQSMSQRRRAEVCELLFQVVKMRFQIISAKAGGIPSW